MVGRLKVQRPLWCDSAFSRAESVRVYNDLVSEVDRYRDGGRHRGRGRGQKVQKTHWCDATL